MEKFPRCPMKCLSTNEGKNMFLSHVVFSAENSDVTSVKLGFRSAARPRFGARKSKFLGGAEQEVETTLAVNQALKTQP